jgi:hypothetical protein
MSRTGKIAKLPREIRDELNHRLERGVSGRELVEWLNALPEVQDALTRSFEGRPLNEQNISEWRRGGFAEWQTKREFFEHVREMAHDASDLEENAALMADHAARLLAILYASALSDLSKASSRQASSSGDSPPPPDLSLLSFLQNAKQLYSLTRALVALRRSDHSAARLKMDKENHDFTRRSRASAENIPDHKNGVILAGMRELIHGCEASRNQAESNQIKPVPDGSHSCLPGQPVLPGPTPQTKSNQIKPSSPKHSLPPISPLPPIFSVSSLSAFPLSVPAIPESPLKSRLATQR